MRVERLEGALPNLRPQELLAARLALGDMWGLGRRLSHAEMAVCLGFHRRDAYLKYEAPGGEPTGPMSTAVRAMLAGYVPPNAPWLDHDREAFIHQMAGAIDTSPARVRLAVQRLEDEGMIRGPNERREPLAAGVRRLSRP